MENAIRARRLHFFLFFGENRILGCLGGILEASWAVLAKFLSRLGPQLGSNLDPKMALELPKGRPRGAYRSPKREPPKSRPEPSKTPQEGAQTPSKPRVWSILGRI